MLERPPLVPWSYIRRLMEFEPLPYAVLGFFDDVVVARGFEGFQVAAPAPVGGNEGPARQ